MLPNLNRIQVCCAGCIDPHPAVGLVFTNANNEGALWSEASWGEAGFLKPGEAAQRNPAHVGMSAFRNHQTTTGPQLPAPTIFSPQFPFPLLHEIPRPSSFLTSAIWLLATSTYAPLGQPNGARCHRPRAWFWVPAAWWPTWLLLVASGGAAWLPLPLSSCGAEQVASWTICCTDFVLVSLSDAAWLLSGRGLGLVRSLFRSLLPGVGKKINF